jgi:hypothetical protein
MAGVRLKIPPPDLLLEAETLTQRVVRALKGDPAVPKHVVRSVRRALRHIRRAIADIDDATLAGPVAWCQSCSGLLALLRRDPHREAWLAACLFTTCSAYEVHVLLAASGAVIGDRVPARTGSDGA